MKSILITVNKKITNFEFFSLLQLVFQYHGEGILIFFILHKYIKYETNPLLQKKKKNPDLLFALSIYIDTIDMGVRWKGVGQLLLYFQI